ncbi:DUF4259 domain-containing protein [Streptomyces sp. NBC_01167]|uniref:DUF4259 domain-containing protein n=1 Tax=Streptomyces sp. NBC_01167 TaxID=2903756 RepID=UPI0038691089|nr:DUF4259 domain-containing protein [Streptomyces sp. NBC_01167]
MPTEPPRSLTAISDHSWSAPGRSQSLQTEAISSARHSPARTSLPARSDHRQRNYGPSEPLPELPADLRTLAVDALDQVVSELSELAELWAEAANG